MLRLTLPYLNGAVRFGNYQTQTDLDSIENYFRTYGGTKMVRPEVVSESVGHQPKHNLYTELLPHAGRLLGGN